ncbi:MAG: NtaA/DmoA family FMN-dependent monooxygenase [Mycobacterium sp.]
MGYGSANLWKHPEDRRIDSLGFDFWTRSARQIESAGIDFVFFGDVLAVYEAYEGSARPSVLGGVELPAHDPFSVASAMLAVTERLGVVVTASTTYEHPFSLARRFSTLDHLSGGRIGWNIVTSYLPRAAQNFGFTTAIPHDQRYDRAEEFLEVTRKLWEDSWDDDAYVGDPATGVFARPDGVHTIDHAGPLYPVRGPHLSPPSPQRSPALFQATWSKRGLQFAARHAEVVFGGSQSAELMREGIDFTREEAAEAGRDPNTLSFAGAFSFVTASTRAEVDRKVADLQRIHESSTDALAASYGDWTGVDLAKFASDNKISGSSDHTQSEYQNKAAAHTAGQVWNELRDLGGGEATHFVGTPDDVVDAIEGYVHSTGIDALVVRPFLFPGTVDDFAEHLAPRLRDRGLLAEPVSAPLRSRFSADGSARLGTALPRTRTP